MVKPGRPKAGYYKPKLIRLTTKQWEKLERHRDISTIPVAVQIRIAVDEYIKKYNKEK